MQEDPAMANKRLDYSRVRSTVLKQMLRTCNHMLLCTAKHENQVELNVTEFQLWGCSGNGHEVNSFRQLASLGLTKEVSEVHYKFTWQGFQLFLKRLREVMCSPEDTPAIQVLSESTILQSYSTALDTTVQGWWYALQRGQYILLANVNQCQSHQQDSGGDWSTCNVAWLCIRSEEM